MAEVRGSVAQQLYTVYPTPKGMQKHFPWYRERLKMKYLQPSCRGSPSLDSTRWNFLAADLDDLRTGVPIDLPGASMIVKRTREPIPLIGGQRLSHPRVRTEQHMQLDHLHTLYNREGPRNWARQRHVREVESSLLKHPLGLYPHLEQAIPPEVLEEVVHVLDPELNPSDSCLEPSPSSSNTSMEQSNGDEQTDVNNGLSLSSPPPATHRVYQWPLIQTAEEQQAEKSVLASQKVISPDQESRVHKVTCDLVQWAKDLGSPVNDGLSEKTIQNLFTSDYETQPALVAPVHVVELMNVPAELRLESRERTEYSIDVGLERGRGPIPVGSERARVVKTRYGAWYLPVNLWRMKLNESLQYPSREVTEGNSEATVVKSVGKHELFTNLHAAKAFREFIAARKPGARVPEFLRK